MDYNELLKYVRGLCRVRSYKDRSLLSCGARGTFQVTSKGPLITLATRGLSKKKLTETLLHEYAHFLQHQDGFMAYIDSICDGHTTAREWFAGRIELTPMELKCVRNSVLTIEYDAERRGHNLGLTLGAKSFSSRFYLRGAESYMDAIKWSFLRREESVETPRRTQYKGVLLSNKELYAPLGAKKAKRLDSSLRHK
jgi:hypothetical protein